MQLAAQPYGLDDTTAQAGAESAEVRLRSKPAESFVAVSTVYCIAVVYIATLPELHGTAGDAGVARAVSYMVQAAVLCYLFVNPALPH